MKILTYIISWIFLGVTSACQQSTDYEAFIDQDRKGEQAFYSDVAFCKDYANVHAGRNEGSQASGEQFIQKQKLFSLCMEKKNWTRRH